MRLLLDTNVLIWALEDDPRIASVRDLIVSSEVYVSAVSWWEIAIKAGIGKLDMDIHDARRTAAESGFFELPLYGIHSETLAALPPIHRDPFDRMIVAQAMAEPMRLLTGDGVLGAYSDLVQVI